MLFIDSELVKDDVLKLLAVSTFILYVKFLGSTMIQGRKGFQAGTRLPEDGSLPMAKGMPTHNAFDFHITINDEGRRLALENELRWRRIIQNDLESMPMALAVFLISTLADARADIQCATITVYTIARCLHTISFVHQLAVARMLSWIVGVLAIIVAGCNGIVRALL
ncbi:hypothetical protein ATCC90586_000781 [Pythium insidiosum]|nr:hypothetical protein ATCC90586_000781 [Pythium insidiosum]